MATVFLETISPIGIGARGQVYGSHYSLGYIPGTTLRGALAEFYIARNGLKTQRAEHDDLFRQIFIEEKVYFGNLYPSISNIVTLPAPASLHTCKRYGGFWWDEENDHYDPSQHGVIDVRHFTTGDLPECCPQCVNEPLEKVTNFYRVQDGHPQTAVAKRRFLVRSGIDEFTLTSKQGVLFSLDVLEARQNFYGFIRDDNNLLHKAALSGNLEELLVGVAVTRGLGETYCTIAAGANTFSQFVEQTKPMATPISKPCFSIVLYSDVILLDRYLRYTSVLDENILHAEFGADFPAGLEIRLQTKFLSMRIVSGWNVKHGLPKENELAIAAGSVFVFAHKENLSENENRQLNNFFNLIQNQGIGERKSEGFGRVIVNDWFHSYSIDRENK